MSAHSFKVMGFLAETFIHPGSGQNIGAIDLPVARESTTGYPFVPGSGLKGALLDAYGHGQHRTFLFGSSDDGAGSLLVSDLRLLLLPVRSLSGVFRYVTSAHLLQRFIADLQRADQLASLQDAERAVLTSLAGRGRDLQPDQVAVVAPVSRKLFLEEFAYQPINWDDNPLPVIARLIDGLHSEAGRARIDVEGRLAVVDDESLKWFSENALPVRMRNRLDENKQVMKGHLWSEEYLAPETVMYALIGSRGGTADGKDAYTLLDELLADQRGYIQLGGNETLGQGWFQVQCWRALPADRHGAES